MTTSTYGRLLQVMFVQPVQHQQGRLFTDGIEWQNVQLRPERLPVDDRVPQLASWFESSFACV